MNLNFLPNVLLVIKNPFLLSLSVITAYFAPLAGIAFAFTLLLLMDFLTGIWAAKVRGERIKSHIAREKTVPKIIGYACMILICFIIQKEIFIYDWANLTWIATSILSIVELKSICENFEDITGRKVFSKIYKGIFNIFKKNTPELENDKK